MSESKRILVIAPHADDETLGVGGTIARRIVEGDEVYVAVATGRGAKPHPLWQQSAWDQVRAEARRAMTVLGVEELLFAELPAAMVAGVPAHEVNATVFQMIETVQPDVLYVPFVNDLHRDHREIFHAASIAWRSSSATGRKIHAVYCYEVQSETHWNAPYLESAFVPNTWVDIGGYLQKKLDALSCYQSQLRPAPDARSLEAVSALAVWRGSQQHMAAAEAFVAIKLVD